MTVLNYAKALRLGTAVAKAAHLDHHRVWPLPPPFLEPPMGQVTTPDLPIDTVDSDIRLRVKLRANSLTITGGAAMYAMQRATGAANLMWDASVLTAGGMRWRWSTNGTSFAYAPTLHPNGTVIIGQDQFLGMRMERQAGTAQRFYGESSTDGVAWADNGTTVDVATLVPYDSTSVIYVGGVPGGYGAFPGRIYWCQYDAIHLARLQFPGYGGAVLTGPTLWGTGGTTQGVEIFVRASSNWATTSADLQGFVYAGSRWGVRRTTTQTLQFYMYGSDGTSSTSTANQPAGWVDNQMVWLHVAYDGTTITFQWAPDSIAVPTTWTDLRTPMAVTTPGLRAATNPLVIGADTPTGTSRLLIGRVARVIVRDTVGGPAVFDMSENDAGNMGAATSFSTRSGHTITPPNITAPWPFLDTNNYATTPDTPDLRILGDVRLTAKVRDDSDEFAQSRMISDRSTGGYAWRMATYGAQFMVVGWPTGLASPQISIYPGTRVQMGLTPPGADPVYVGAELVGVDPSSQALTLVPTGITSPDGITWTRRTPVASVRADAVSYPSTGTLRINYGWAGRIYWAQLERINRRSFVFPGTSPPNYMSVPPSNALDLTSDFEFVFRAAMDWHSTASADQQWIMSKFAGGGNRSYGIRFYSTYPGRPQLLRSSDGSGTGDTATATTAVPFAKDQPGWVKMTHTAATGTAKFFTAPDAGTNIEPAAGAWTQLGGDRPGYSPSTFVTPVALTIGMSQYVSGGGPLNGRLHRLIMRNEFGRTVLDLNTTNPPGVAVGATALTSSDTANRYTWLPGVTGNYISIPDSVPLRVTGDGEWVARINPVSWTPAVQGTVVAKYTNVYASWGFLARPDGKLNLLYVPPGGQGANAVSTVAVPFTTGTAGWIKATRRQSDGVVQFFTAPDAPAEPTGWTKLGADVTTVVGLLQDTPAVPVYIGARWNDFRDPFAGRVRRVIVRSAIGGSAVLDFDADVNLNGIDPAAASFALTTGGTATVVRAGSPQLELVTGRSPVTVVQSVTTIPGLRPEAGNVSIPDPGSVPVRFMLVTRFRMPPMGNFNVISSTSYQFAFTASNLYVRIYSGGGFQGGAVANLAQLQAAGVVPGADVWLAGSVDTDAAGQVVYKAFTSPNGLAPWTQLGSTVSFAMVPTVVSSAVTVGNPATSVWAGGVLYSAELRDGLNPNAGTVQWRFDASEYPGTGLTYTDPRGRTWTLSSAGIINPKTDPVVQALPDMTVWRYDASEAPAGATTYTDPRGRAWTMTAPVTPANASPIVTPQPDRTIWRFDANDWPAGALTAVGADGRTYIASNGNAVQHPASEPDP